MKIKYFTIMAQGCGIIYKCQGVRLITHSSSEYFRPYFIVTCDKNEYIY